MQETVALAQCLQLRVLAVQCTLLLHTASSDPATATVNVNEQAQVVVQTLSVSRHSLLRGISSGSASAVLFA
jgi:hypothetical protein